MSPIINKNNYDPHQPGSYYSIGSETAPTKIIFLHGIGSYAGNPEESQNSDLYKAFKHMDVELTYINGSKKVDPDILVEDMLEEFKEDFKEEFKDVPLYRWEANESQNTSDQLNALIEKHRNQNAKHIFLFGFSQGGLKAHEQLMHAPEKISGAILHSAGLIKPMNKHFKDAIKKTKEKPNILTIIGKKDPLLKDLKFAAIALPIHYFNAFSLGISGIKSRTKFIDGLAHEMNNTSINVAIDHIQKQIASPQI